MYKKIKTMTYDDWSNLLQILAVSVAVLLIFVQIKSGKAKDIKAKKQEQTIAEINLKVEQESFKRIKAETKLLELQKKISWRTFDFNKFVDILNTAEIKGDAEIIFLKDDNESYSMAYNFWEALGSTGWEVKQPHIGSYDENGNENIPFSMREGGIITSVDQRVIIALSENTIPKPYDNKTALSVLLLAMQSCGIEFIQTVPHQAIRPPKGVIRIIVGSRI